LVILKDWYKKIEKKISLKNTKKIEIILKKEIIFKENISKNNSENKKVKVKKTRTEVLAELKNRKNNYKIIELKNQKKIYVKNRKDKLEFFLETTKLFDYKIINSENIFISEIFWNKKYLFLKLKEKKYLLNISTKNLIFLELNPKINYIKNYSNNYEFDIVTDLWTYIFDIKTKKIRFFSKFNDFIYIKPKYIGLVDSQDKVKKKNLWYEDKTGSLIISYNEKTKQKNILKEVFFKVEKILKNNNKIILIWENWKEYILENF
jgi:hypothetical protein